MHVFNIQNGIYICTKAELTQFTYGDIFLSVKISHAVLQVIGNFIVIITVIVVS